MRTNSLKFFGARRLSNVFRVCRQGLTALTVALALMACDQLLTTGGSGVDIPVKIRAVSIAGGAQNETVTRAGGGSSEKRMVQEPIVQDLGGGMLAEITVEEDVSALRDDPYKKLENNAKLRIIALEQGTSEIYSWADYTATSSGEFSKVAGNLHVVSGVKYDFICFSYNDPSSETSWPDALNEGGTLDVLTVDNTRDFLYKKLTDKEFNATSNTLDLTLVPQLAKVKLEFDAGTGKTIEGIDNSKITLDGVATTVNFNLATVSASSVATTGKLAFGGGTTGSRTLTSGEISFFPQSAGSYTLSWPANAVTVADGEIERFLAAGSVTILHSKFAVGCSYTIQLKLFRIPKFAGSNIYWDDVKSQLTFDPHGDYTHTKYQGVFIKWGSLIGISPVEKKYDSNVSILYTPKDIAQRTWEPTTGSAEGWDSWTDIPSCYNVNITSPAGKDAKTLLVNPNFTDYKGDICNYINPAYRMPTALELDSLCVSYKGFTRNASDVPGTTDNDVAGKYTFTTNYGTLTGFVLPASGYRNYDDGLLNYVGDDGRCWSSSACSGTDDAYTLYFNYSSGNAGTNEHSRSYGRAVRCVLQE